MMGHAASRVAQLLALAALGTPLSCHEPFSNEDIVFLKSLPNSELVRFSIPGDPGSGLRATGTGAGGLSPAQELGPVSEFYLIAKRISREFNGGLLYVLSLVEQVTQVPPTQREDDLRVWGPFPEGEREYVLLINRKVDLQLVPTVRDEPVEVDLRYEYVMRGRRAGGEWEDLFGGFFAPIESDRRGIGTLVLNFDAAARVNPESKERGFFAVRYDTRAGSVRIELGIDFPQGDERPFAQPDGFYSYRRDAQGDIDFLFAAFQDVHENDPSKSKLELLAILARWRSDNRGRADVSVEGGDLPGPVVLRDCWNQDFRRVYFESSAPELGPAFGSVEQCAPELRTPIVPDRN